MVFMMAPEDVSSNGTAQSTLSTEPDSHPRLTVAVRVRPLNENEKMHPKVFKCAYPLDSKRILLIDPEKMENNILRQNRQFERQFIFDAAFGPNSTHMEVHSNVTGPLVDSVVKGYNATVFAYGPTGSGKTYTMVGTRQTPGLMSLLTKTLYEKINPDEFTVYISFLEIYNEVIRDLLIPTSAVLDLLEDEKGLVQVPGLSRVKASNTNKIMQILQEGNLRRTQEPTATNQNSSRSHALLQVALYKHSIQHGKLFLIDLAGSERASHTQNRGQRLKEGAAINRSLLALGNVINALSSGSKGRYVNYRDSKLTRLLKDSLGGNSMTCMIAHVTPSSTNYDETYNTLMYANRAKNITTRLTLINRPTTANDEPQLNTLQEIRNAMKNNSGTAENSPTVRFFFQDDSRNSLVRNNRPTNMPLSNRTFRLGNMEFGAPSFGGDRRRFSSLFNSLKEQYLTGCEKMQRLRERLLKINYEAYEADLNRISKAAILDAWEKHTDDKEGKFSHIIERLQRDSIEQERKISQLQEIRQKIERALRNSGENLFVLEKRMRSLARDPQQIDFIDLLVRMAIRDAESMAATSVSVLQGLRLRRQENSLIKMQKYEQIADRLISSNQLSERDREQLEQEYKIVKNQLNFHLIPLKQINSWNMDEVSWNTLFLKNSKKIYPHNVELSRLNPILSNNREERLTVNDTIDNNSDSVKSEVGMIKLLPQTRQPFPPIENQFNKVENGNTKNNYRLPDLIKIEDDPTLENSFEKDVEENNDESHLPIIFAGH